jgi:hypothetical protein
MPAGGVPHTGPTPSGRSASTRRRASRPSVGRSPPPALSRPSDTYGRIHGGHGWSTSCFTASPALVSRQHATLIDLPRLYTDDTFRQRVLRSVSDPETLRFWHTEFPSYTKAFRSEAVAPILNKAGQFAASPQLRLILGQVAPRLDLKFVMDNRLILIANLAKGALGPRGSRPHSRAARPGCCRRSPTA